MIRNILSKLLIIGSMSICSLSFSGYSFPEYVGAESVVMISPIRLVNEFSVSPVFGKSEISQGTVKQEGWLYGIKANYNILSPCNLYLGAEGGYKAGDLKGKVKLIDPLFFSFDPVTGEVIVKDKTKSKYSDLWAELRVGFTFGELGISGAYLTPYFVIGYEQEKLKYGSPSPIDIKNTLDYGCLGCGLISEFAISNQLSVGLNAKFKWIFHAKVKTGGDAYLEDKGISNSNHFHYTIEVPVSYLISQNISIAVAPFYEFKRYDFHKFEWLGKEKAKFHMWGGAINLNYWF